MTRYDRRDSLRVLAAALAALSTRTLAQEQIPPSRNAGAIAPPPPSRAMIYMRRLVRNLSDKAQIIVERRFTIHFTASATGYVVDGSQLSVEVQTPATLAAFADLERARVENGIFPLELDAMGVIRSGRGADDDVPEIDQAVDYVTRRVAEISAGDGDNEPLVDFVAAIHQAGNNIVSTMPSDLFAPGAGDRSERRQIDLPIGGRGMVSTEFVASRDPVTGLLSRARRDVVTSIGGEERRTTEHFSLTPEPPDRL